MLPLHSHCVVLYGHTESGFESNSAQQRNFLRLLAAVIVDDHDST